MPVPDFRALMLPTLKVCADSERPSLADVRRAVAKAADLTDEDIKEKVPSGRQSTFVNRVFWAVIYMERAGLLRRIGRGGDGGPTEFPLAIWVREAKTGLGRSASIPNAINSGRPNFSGAGTGWSERSGLKLQTAYVLTVESAAAGFGEDHPLVKRCFMTGGTYTTPPPVKRAAASR